MFMMIDHYSYGDIMGYDITEYIFFGQGYSNFHNVLAPSYAKSENLPIS